MTRTRKFAAAFAALFLIATVMLAIGFYLSLVDHLVFLDHDLHDGGMFGAVLASLIVGFVLSLVAIILTVVFTGVGLLLLFVGLIVGFTLLAIAVPVLLPLIAVLAVPFMVAYGLFRLIRRGMQPAA